MELYSAWSGSELITLVNYSSTMRITTLLPTFIAISLSAQDPLRIWGLTPFGGANNKGTVFSVNADGTDFNTVFDFTEESGWGPEGGLCLAPNGLLYGLTTFGGEGSPAAGTLFTIDPSSGAFNKLRDFSISNGGFNWGTPFVGDDGMIYGAGYAGTDGGGSIYRIDPSTNTYTELHALHQATDGGAITGRLLHGDDGLIYGTASQGGANGEAGTLFSYDPAGDVFTRLHDFDGADGGRTPYGGVCQAGNGVLYGTTYEGGLNNRGIIYKFDVANDVFTKIHDMDEDNGGNCWNSMLRLGPDLLLGGVATGSLNSGGYLFTLVPSMDEVTLVTNFSLLTGANPVGDLVTGADGELYGLLSQGGTGAFGTLCRFDATTYQPSVLHHFTGGSDGGLPRGEPLAISASVGIADQAEDAFFRVTPNPTDGMVTIRCDAAHFPTQIRITDALGRALAVTVIKTATMTIDLGDAPGIRFVTLTTDGRTHMERVVVR